MPVESLLPMIFKNHTSVNLIKGNVTFKVLHQYMFDKELYYLTINEHTLIPKTFLLSIIFSFIFLTL